MPTTILNRFNLVPTDPELEVGIEIEMESRGRLIPPRLPRGWSIAGDGSLRGAEAAEFYFTRPVSRKDYADRIYSLKTVFARNECTWTDSERCGVHVHLNSQQETGPDIVKFSVLYYILEEVLSFFCAPSRRDNLFCLRAVDGINVIQVLHECVRRCDLGLMISDKYRYASLNFTSLAKFGSLEFRMLETPQNLDKIIQWVDLLLIVRDKAREYDNPPEILEGISGMGGEAFMRHVFQDKVSLFPEIPDLDQRIIDGVRIVQHLAYTPWNEKPPRPPRPRETVIDEVFMQRVRGMQFRADALRMEPIQMAEPILNEAPIEPDLRLGEFHIQVED